MNHDSLKNFNEKTIQSFGDRLCRKLQLKQIKIVKYYVPKRFIASISLNLLNFLIPQFYWISNLSKASAKFISILNQTKFFKT